MAAFWDCFKRNWVSELRQNLVKLALRRFVILMTGGRFVFWKLVLFASAFALCLIGCSSSDQPKTPLRLSTGATDTPASASDANGYQVIQVPDGGSITGTIKVSGPIPQLPKRDITKDPKVCGTGTRDSQQLIVSKDGALKNAVVIVEDVKRGKPVPESAQNAQINQKNCEYDPHVFVVAQNSNVSILNSDPTLHNIHMYQGNDSLFNIAQPVRNQVNNHKLEKVGMVYAECDVHGWMQAHIAVVNNPYYAVTDNSGTFSIRDLPLGTYKVKVWHEYLGEKTQEITVNPKTEFALNLDLRDLLDAKKPTSVPITSAAPSAGARTSPLAAAGASGPGPEVIVRMVSEGTEFRYEPNTLTIKAGTTVKWVNVSDNKHTSTDDPEFEQTAGQALVPAGAEFWTSPFLSNGDTFSRKFTVPGKYRFFCRNHEQPFGMVGTITVVP
jgi:plastocyanin